MLKVVQATSQQSPRGRRTAPCTFVPARTKAYPRDNRDYSLRGEQFRSLRQENLRRFKNVEAQHLVPRAS